MGTYYCRYDDIWHTSTTTPFTTCRYKFARSWTPYTLLHIFPLTMSIGTKSHSLPPLVDVIIGVLLEFVSPNSYRINWSYHQGLWLNGSVISGLGEEAVKGNPFGYHLWWLHYTPGEKTFVLTWCYIQIATMKLIMFMISYKNFFFFFFFFF